MYNWDIDKIKSNRQRVILDKDRYPISIYSAILDYYNTLDSYMEGCRNPEIDSSLKTDKYYLTIAKTEKKLIESSKIIDSLLFKGLINQEKSSVIQRNIDIDNNYNEKEALINVEGFYCSIFPYKNIVKNLIDNKVILIKKDEFYRGCHIFDSTNNNHYIGVIAPNIEFMMYTLVHEIGHYIATSKGLRGLSDNETLPLLLELYFSDYIKDNNYDSIPFFQNDYVTNRNNELITLETFYNTFNSTDDNYIINEYKKLQDKTKYIATFDKVINYCVSKYRAIDYYRNTHNKLDTINSVIDESKKIRTISELFDNTSSSIFLKENDDIVKRLVRG